MTPMPSMALSPVRLSSVEWQLVAASVRFAELANGRSDRDRRLAGEARNSILFV